MNSDYTFLEAIHLIIDFYTSPKGYFIDEDFEYPEVRKFIDAGCASLGEEHKEKYLLNEKGASILHPYIEEISSKFIQFMERKQNTATIKETENWFHPRGTPARQWRCLSFRKNMRPQYSALTATTVISAAPCAAKASPML